ncbi:hypothetical protein BX616_008447, partial [Lobosporangium transversale]
DDLSPTPETTICCQDECDLECAEQDQRYITDWKEIDWKATLHIIHDGNTPITDDK